MNCLACNKEIKSFKKYCDRSCQRAYGAEKIYCDCKKCGKPFKACRESIAKNRFKYLCRCCRDNQTGLIPLHSLSGPDSPRWKGGHKHWSKGRNGKDKDGLSWKTQRKLAWERDNYECQHCHQKKNRKPDVHHIKPWMNSHSHALENLICLCQQCHLTEEAKVQEIWGGQLINRNPPIVKEKRACSICHNRIGRGRNKNGNICNSCLVDGKIKEAIELRSQGISLREIMCILNVSMGTASHYANGGKFRGERKVV